MDWGSVGSWIKDNAGDSAVLVGSLLTGNVPAAIAAGAAIVSSATGTTNPTEALSKLQDDPATMIRLRELAVEEDQNIRTHLADMMRIELEDKQKEHQTTQETIRGGDQSVDVEIRRTRPKMARESWTATIAYCIAVFGIKAVDGRDLFDIYLASVLSAPAWAYLGLRTGDKLVEAWKGSKLKT